MKRRGGRRPTEVRLKRKAFFVDERVLREARTALGAESDAEAVRISLERIAEMETFWQFMKNSRRTLAVGSIERP